MTTRTSLCRFETRDGETLHGALFQPEALPTLDLVLILVHGVAMNFYIGPLPLLGQMLAERGYHCFSINTRGHDWICRAGNFSAFGGATYENFEDCLTDLDGALKYLNNRGYQRFVLVGHSLGSVKSLFYQGTRQRPEVAGVNSCSAPKQFYSARALEQPEFKKHMAEAETFFAAGRGEEFLWVPASGGRGLFTARTYVSKYGPHEKNDVRPHAARLLCPLLATAGGAEEPVFSNYARELAEAAGAEHGTVRIIEDADHFYHGHESVLAHTIAAWLDGLNSPRGGR